MKRISFALCVTLAAVASHSVFAQSPSITVFRLPTSTSRPQGITAGPDGNLWFTEYLGGKIGRITPNPPHTITEFTIPTPDSLPWAITSGPDGNLWFTEEGGDKIGRITPGGTNSITEYRVVSVNQGPRGITLAADGNLWFVEAGYVGRVTPDGVVSEFSFPGLEGQSGGEDIVAGADGNLWFSRRYGDTFGRFAPGDLTTYVTFNGRPDNMTNGPDGTIWFVASVGGSAVGRITPDGTVTEFPTADPVTNPFGITTGPDGNLWFTESGRNRIGRILPEVPNIITEFELPGTDNDPAGITKGPDGNLWVALFFSDSIGLVNLTGPQATPSPTVTATPTATPICAPTGTPYAGDCPQCGFGGCFPCPTVRANCLAVPCGLCNNFTPTVTPTSTGTPTVTGNPTPSPSPAPPPCIGDCDGNRQVTGDEILNVLNIALGNRSASSCNPDGGNLGSQIRVDKILKAVTNEVNGCGTPIPHIVEVAPNGQLRFNPPALTIHVGDTVQWTWGSSGHSVVGGSGCTADGKFCSPNDSDCAHTSLSTQGTMYTHTFNAPGKYPYFCSQHCAFSMVGSVTVQ